MHIFNPLCLLGALIQQLSHLSALGQGTILQQADVMTVTAAKLKKVEFDQDSKIQALQKTVHQIMCDIEAEKEAEEAFRVG